MKRTLDPMPFPLKMQLDMFTVAETEGSVFITASTVPQLDQVIPAMSILSAPSDTETVKAVNDGDVQRIVGDIHVDIDASSNIVSPNNSEGRVMGGRGPVRVTFPRSVAV